MQVSKCRLFNPFIVPVVPVFPVVWCCCCPWEVAYPLRPSSGFPLALRLLFGCSRGDWRLFPPFLPPPAIPLVLLHCFERPSWAWVTTLLLLMTPAEEVVALLLLVLVLELLLLFDAEKFGLFPLAPLAELAPVGNLAGTPGPPMAGLASRLRHVKQPARSEAYINIRELSSNPLLKNYKTICYRKINFPVLFFNVITI